MKHKQKQPWLLNSVLAFLLGLAGISCMITGFNLGSVSWPIAAGCIALFALLSGFCFTHRFGLGVLLAVTAGVLYYYIVKEDLAVSISQLLYAISYRYNGAYGWGIIGTMSIANGVVWETDYTPALVFIACLVTAAANFSLCRRSAFAIALILGFLPLLSCCVVTDTVPDIWALWLFLAMVMLILLTQRVRTESPVTGKRLTAILLIPVILATSSLFYALPQDGVRLDLGTIQQEVLDMLPFLDGILTGNGKGPGNTELSSDNKLDLQTVGPRSVSGRAVFSAVSSIDQTLYLRGQAYDTYTGTGWKATLNGQQDQGWPTLGLQQKATVTVTPHTSLDLMYFPYYLSQSYWQNDLLGGSIENENPDSVYIFQQMDISASISTSAADPLGTSLTAIYTALPGDTYANAQDILAQILDSSDQFTWQKAEAIVDYVSSCARYDLGTDYMPEGETDFAIWFLTQSDSGYCTHFATAAVVLLRAADIPARYVTGYAAHVSAGEPATFSDKNAHAWVEYWVSGKGWTVMEPTSSALLSLEAEPTEAATLPTETTEQPEQTRGTKPTLPSDPEDATTSVTKPDQTQSTAESTETSQDTPAVQFDSRYLKAVLWIIGIWAGLCGQYVLRRQCRRAWLRSGSPNRQALRHWRYICRLARITRQEVPQELYILAEKARFSQHTLTPAELSRFSSWLRDTRDHLRQKPWYTRLMMKLVFAVE